LQLWCHHNIRSKGRLLNIMSIGTFIVIFAPEGIFIMIRPNRKVPLELLLWGTNKRLQLKGLSTNNSRGPGKHRNKPTTTNRYNTKKSQTHMNNKNSRWIWSELGWSGRVSNSCLLQYTYSPSSSLVVF
jgi:hypothetical protein